MPMIIFTINKTIFISSYDIIKNGKVLVLDESGNIVGRTKIVNKDFHSYSLEVKRGKYYVRIETEYEVVTKTVYLGK